MHIFRRSNVFGSFLVASCVGAATAVASVQLGGPVYLGFLAAVVALWYGLRRFFRRLLLSFQELPLESTTWLERHVAFYRGLPETEKKRYEHSVQFSLAEMKFEGVAGIEVTDELKLSVAAGIALMWFGRPDWDTPHKHTVLLYPGAFNDNFDLDDRPAFDGMMRENGPMLLSVPAVEYGWRHEDGHNVVLHELAHVMDFQGAGPPGLPALLDPSSAMAWKRLVDQEIAKVRAGRSLLRSYAATNRAELFAVAAELFFERSRDLNESHPELFSALVALFNFDPTPVTPDVVTVSGNEQQAAG